MINEIVALQRRNADVFPVSLFPPQRCQNLLMSRVLRKAYDFSEINRVEEAAKTGYLPEARRLVERYELSPWYAEFSACVAQYATDKGLQLLHAHFATESALVAMLAGELTGLPFSFTAHAYDLFIEKDSLPGERLHRRLKLLCKRAARIITVSEFNRRYLQQITKCDSQKIEVIHCGIDTGRFTHVERGGSESFRILCVGRFVEKKGHEFLLRAFRELSDALPRAQLRLVGEGPLQRRLEEVAREYGVKDKVAFLGAVPSEQVLEEMKNADVFVLHSVTAANGDMEGIPVSLMEALATGLPVVSTRHSGIPELVIDGETGLLTEERDRDLTAAALLRLAGDPPLRRSLGCAGSFLVRERFDQGTEAAKLRAIFAEVVGENAVPETEYLPFVSVVIPVYNGEETLDLCLDSIANLEYPKDRLEVIVVDNGSTDATLQIATRHRVQTLQELDARSSYAARNKGIMVAKGELIAFTDADCVVTPLWLRHLVGCWSDESIGCFAGEIEAYQPQDLVEVFSDRAGILRQNGTLTCPYLPYTQTANSAYRKSVFDSVGLFHPEMTSGGDADISWRMQKQQGLRIKFVPEALVYHKHRTSLEGLHNQFKKYEHGKLSWLERYFDYQLPSVAERRKDVDYWLGEMNSSLPSGTERYVRGDIDFVELLTPFLRYIMALGTYKARTEMDAGLKGPEKPPPSVSSASLAVSVIICTYNRSALLAESLRAVVRQDFSQARYEIVVVDNNSTDDTRTLTELIAKASPVRIKYVPEMRQGLSFARNTGIDHAEGEIVCFVDDDIDAETGWLKGIVAAFDDPRVACAGGPIRPVWPFTKPLWISKDWEGYLTVSEFDSARRSGEFSWPNYPWGANIAFRRSVFEKVGRFPTELGRTGKSLLSNEEVNLCKRIEAAGLKIRFAPDAVIHHKIPAERLTKSWFLHRTAAQGKSDAILDASDSELKYARVRSFASILARNRGRSNFDSRCLDRLITGYLYQLIGGAPYSEFSRMRALKTLIGHLLNNSRPETVGAPASLQERLIDTLNEELALKGQLIAEQKKRNVELEQRLGECERRLARFHQSLSWRITAPLRMVYEALLRCARTVSSNRTESG